MSRPPCFRRIWRDCSSDMAWFEFWFGPIYEYFNTGASTDAVNIANALTHGTYFNFSVRQPPPGSYLRGAVVPGTAELIYEYPPYTLPSPVVACGVCAGSNVDWHNVTWAVSGSAGSTVVPGSGLVVVASAPVTVTGPAVVLQAQNICVDPASSVGITIDILSTHGFNNYNIHTLGTGDNIGTLPGGGSFSVTKATAVGNPFLQVTVSYPFNGSLSYRLTIKPPK